MLYLAQVEKQDAIKLRLLACQTSEYTWTVLPKHHAWVSLTPDALNRLDPPLLQPGVLLLAELSDHQDVMSLKAATDWIMGIVRDYLSHGFTPAFLQQEAERLEQWQQSLTLQNQELGRRAIEMEARREEIQALEEELRQEHRQVESLAEALKSQTPRSV